VLRIVVEIELRIAMLPGPKETPTAARPETSAACAFGANLYRARINAGMTQAAVAIAAGLSLNRMSLIEKGRSDLRMSSAHALARAVGVSLKALVPD
jgi:DNA-binding XRE family transcriptional regulator